MIAGRFKMSELEGCNFTLEFNGTQVRPRPFWPESLGSRPPPVWAVALPTFDYAHGYTAGHDVETWLHVRPMDHRPFSIFGASFETSAEPDRHSPIRRY